MSSRRSRLLICTVLLIPMLLCACGRETELPRWSFGVEGAEIEVFSSFDYAKLDEVSITVEKPQDGGASEELRGVYLKDVLDYLDVSEYSSITLTSRGGSSIDYAPEIMKIPPPSSFSRWTAGQNGKTVLRSCRWFVRILTCGCGILRH